MDRIIVQRGNKKSKNANIYRSEGKELTIGRAFDNDFLVTDPYVAEHQIKLFYEDEHWLLIVLDKLNPVFVNGELVFSQIIIKSGDQVTIGHTQLSLFSEQHQQEKTRRLLFSAKWYQKGFVRNVTIIGILLNVLFAYIESYNASYVSLNWKELTTVILSLVAGIFVFSGIFSLIAKVVIRQSHYFLLVMVTSLVMALSGFLAFIPEYVEYQLNHKLVGQITQYILSFIIILMLLKLNLYFSTHMAKSTLVAASISFCLLGVNVYSDHFTSERENQEPSFSKVVKPPFSQLASPLTLNQHFKEIQPQQFK